MKAIDYFEKPVTVLASANGYNAKGEYVQRDIPLKSVLNMGCEWKDAIERLRGMTDEEEQKRLKLKFPCWIAGGTFPFKELADDKIVSYTNLMVVDIDKKDNPNVDFEIIKRYMFDLACTLFVSKSIRGNGLYVVVAIDDGAYTKEYYSAFADYLEHHYDVKVDRACKNVARKRFISYDDEMLIKDDDVEIVPLKARFETKKTELVGKETSLSNDIFGWSDEFTCGAIALLIEKYGYRANTEPEWFMDGLRLATFGEWGRQLFIELSRRSDKFRSEKDASRKFDACKKVTRMDKSSLTWYFKQLKLRVGEHWMDAVKEYIS